MCIEHRIFKRLQELFALCVCFIGSVVLCDKAAAEAQLWVQILTGVVNLLFQFCQPVYCKIINGDRHHHVIRSHQRIYG